MLSPHHVSHVRCQVSGVRCHVSRVTCHNIFFLQRGWAIRWRVCYQRGLPRPVYLCLSLIFSLTLTSFTQRSFKEFLQIYKYTNILSLDSNLNNELQRYLLNSPGYIWSAKYSLLLPNSRKKEEKSERKIRWLCENKSQQQSPIYNSIWHSLSQPRFLPRKRDAWRFSRS